MVGMHDSFPHQPDGPQQESGSANPTDTSYPASTEADWLAAEAALSRPTAIPPSPHQLDPLESASTRSNTALVMVETAFLASAASLIWLVNYYFPLGPVLRLFFPIPIALIYLRWNSRAAWMGALVTGLLLSVLMGPVRSILYVIPFGLLGVLLGFFWRRQASWSISIGIGSLLGAFGLFFRIWLVSILLGDNLWLYATTQVTDLLDWIFVKLGLLIQPGLPLIQVAVVVMVLFNNLVYLFVVHLVALFLLDRLGNPIPRPPQWVLTLLEYE